MAGHEMRMATRPKLPIQPVLKLPMSLFPVMTVADVPTVLSSEVLFERAGERAALRSEGPRVHLAARCNVE